MRRFNEKLGDSRENRAEELAGMHFVCGPLQHCVYLTNWFKLSNFETASFKIIYTLLNFFMISVILKQSDIHFSFFQIKKY